MSRPSVRVALASACLAIFATPPSRALACATCGCGDPTLTAVGVEKPYKNRLRVAVEERVGERSSGADAERTRLFSTRTQLSLSYTPHVRLTLAALLPMSASFRRATNGRDSRIVGLGDLDLQVRVLVARDRSFSPQHLLWLMGGVKTPTGPRLRDDAGYPYSDDDQPGSGSWDPVAGATYAWFGGLVSFYSAVVYRHPTAGPRGYRVGPSLLSSAVAQLQPFSRWAFQLGADLRYGWSDMLSNGAAAPDSGGFIAALVPSVLVNPWRDLVLRVSTEVPVYQALHGVQSIGPQGVLTISYDFL